MATRARISEDACEQRDTLGHGRTRSLGLTAERREATARINQIEAL